MPRTGLEVVALLLPIGASAPLVSRRWRDGHPRQSGECLHRGPLVRVLWKYFVYHKKKNTQ